MKRFLSLRSGPQVFGADLDWLQLQLAGETPALSG